MAFGQEFFKQSRVHQAALHIHPQALPLVEQLIVNAQNGVVIRAGYVVGLHRGQALAGSVFHGGFQRPLHLLFAHRRRDGLFNNLLGAALQQNAVGPSIRLQFQLSALHLRHMIPYAGLLQRQRVAGGNMAAGSGEQQRMLLAYLVQRMAGGHLALFREIILIPAPAFHRLPFWNLVFLDKSAACVDHILQAGAGGKIHPQQVLAHMIQMLVGIHKTGNQRAALDVDFFGLRGGGQNFLIAAYLSNLSILNQQGLSKSLSLQINISVIKNGIHSRSPPLF